MGAQNACCRSRLAEPLQDEHLKDLLAKTLYTAEQLRQWHSRFVHCYPHGYLSYRKFLVFYQQLHGEFDEGNELLIREIFHVADVNDDQRIDFHEFVLFDMLINEGSDREKLEFICRFYGKDKTDKLLSKRQLKDFWKNVLHLFDIPFVNSQLNQLIDDIYVKLKLNPQADAVNWTRLRTLISSDPFFFQQLAPAHRSSDDESFDDGVSVEQPHYF
jgi:Ca2+-binding EF-hand superfamily protein